MNSSQSRRDTAVDEQAAYWAARLDGGFLEAADRADLELWLAKSPSHRAQLSQYCQLSADLEEQLPVLVQTGAVQMPVDPAPAKPFWKFPHFAAMALVATAAIVLGVRVLSPAAVVENFSTAVAERKNYTLGDGTQIELNADTSLRFENTKTERRVRLARGEAMFRVTKDPSRPFIVQTPTGVVRVTGTTFNVRTETAALEVTVVEGSVQVRPGDMAGPDAAKPFSLGARDYLSARAGSATVTALSETVLEDALAWRTGEIVFNDVPLRVAAARFAQYHGCTINVSDTAAGENVGSRYSLDDLKTFLDGLEVGFGLTVTHEPNGTISIRK